MTADICLNSLVFPYPSPTPSWWKLTCRLCLTNCMLPPTHPDRRRRRWGSCRRRCNSWRTIWTRLRNPSPPDNPLMSWKPLEYHVKSLYPSIMNWHFNQRFVADHELLKTGSKEKGNEWMNEWTNLLLVFLTLGPTVLATRLKDDSTRLDIFNRASYPVIICFSFNPLAQPLAERTWAGSGILVYLTPALTMHQSNPSPLPPIFWAGPPNPHLFDSYPIYD